MGIQRTIQGGNLKGVDCIVKRITNQFVAFNI